jgi:hypothetical protein
MKPALKNDRRFPAKTLRNRVSNHQENKTGSSPRHADQAHLFEAKTGTGAAIAAGLIRGRPKILKHWTKTKNKLLQVMISSI